MARFVKITEMAGVMVSGTSPIEIDAEFLESVRDAFRREYMVLIRGQQFTREQCVQIGEAVGTARVRTFQRGSDTDQTTMISNVHEGGRLPNGELLFHTDGMFFNNPLRAIALFALQVPSKGGETLFANSRAAYRILPQALKDRIANLEARHVWNYSSETGNERPDPDDFNATTRFAIHPLAWPHPDTKEMVLFASKMFTDSVVGLSRVESDQILDELFSYIESPKIRYEHKWQVGDFLLWDNRAFQHARANFDPNEPRALLRVPIIDPDEASAAA